jgi:hypothetical protein
MAVELDATARCGAAGVWSTCGREALHLAAANGGTNVCRYLVQDLAFPVDAPSSSGETPLLLAATFGHTATAAYLLKRGADPRSAENDGDTPLHWAAYNGTNDDAGYLWCGCAHARARGDAMPSACGVRGCRLSDTVGRPSVQGMASWRCCSCPKAPTWARPTPGARRCTSPRSGGTLPSSASCCDAALMYVRECNTPGLYDEYCP